MKLERKVLLNNLRLAMPGIESGNVVLQGSDSFVFHDGKLFTYNDSMAVLVPMDSIGLVDENLEGAVHAKELYNVVSKFTNDEITFTVKDEKTWTIKCGRAKVELTLLDFDFKSRLEGVAPSDERWVDLPEGFTNALAVCKMPSNKSTLAGIYVRDDNVLSTDSYQINVCTIGKELPKFWISDNSATELLKLEGLEKIQVGRNWVHFKTKENVVFSTKTLNNADYPYEKVMALMETACPKDETFHATFPKELFPAVERANNFSLDLLDQSVVRLVLSKEGIEVSSERNSGNYVENVPWETPLEDDFEPIKVYVNEEMMGAMVAHSLEFYLMNMVAKNGKIIPRLLFVSPSSRHLMATFSE